MRKILFTIISVIVLQFLLSLSSCSKKDNNEKVFGVWEKDKNKMEAPNQLFEDIAQLVWDRDYIYIRTEILNDESDDSYEWNIIKARFSYEDLTHNSLSIISEELYDASTNTWTFLNDVPISTGKLYYELSRDNKTLYFMNIKFIREKQVEDNY